MICMYVGLQYMRDLILALCDKRSDFVGRFNRDRARGVIKIKHRVDNSTVFGLRTAHGISKRARCSIIKGRHLGLLNGCCHCKSPLFRYEAGCFSQYLVGRMYSSGIRLFFKGLRHGLGLRFRRPSDMPSSMLFRIMYIMLNCSGLETP